MNSASQTLASTGRVLIAAAACIALYLASIALGRTALPGCTSTSSCLDILQSRWAFAFGIPVSFLGFVLYCIALLLSGAFVRRERTFAGLKGAMAVTTIIAGGFWFMVIQFFALRSLCAWCCATHALAVAGALCLWRSRMKTQPPPLDCSTDLRDAGSPLSNERIFRFTATGTALTAIGLLALGALSGPLYRQEPSVTVIPQHAASSSAAKQYLIPVGGLKIHPGEYPYIGSSAPHAIHAVLISDYTCEWCRSFYSSLSTAANRVIPPVRITLLPASRSTEAEAIQRTLLTVFHSSPEKWSALSALLTSGQIPATADASGKAALKLTGDSQLAGTALRMQERIQSQLDIANAVMDEIHSRTGNKVLPQLICGDHILSGAEPDVEKIAAFFRGSGAITQSPEPKPKIQLLDTQVIITGLTAGESRDVQIKVRNSGAAPLKLGWLAVDPGCEVISLPERHFYPGETAVIGIRVTSSESTEARHVKIHSNAPGIPPEISLRVTQAQQVAAGSSIK